MLSTSTNHYLRTEYLSPIQGNNIELDAKKSPLALLAHTCSLIGASLPPKTAAATGDKEASKGKVTPSEKSSSASAQTTEEVTKSAPFRPYEKKGNEKEVRASSPNSKFLSSLARSPAGASPDRPRTTSRGSDGCNDLPATPLDLPLTSSGTSAATATSRSSPHSPKSTSHNLPSLADISKDPLASYKLPPSLYSPLGLCMDPFGTGLSTLTSKQVSTSNSMVMSTMASPYIGYAKIKTANGNEVIVPICRDPFCSGCQINTHALQVANGTCSPGCSQCAQIAVHTKTLSTLPSSLISSIPTTLSNLYGTQSGLFSGSHQPNVCNWIAGDNYCGKRFPSSEELLQHLRSHTTLATPESPSLSLHSLHQHPLLNGHPSLSRGYPTPPLSPLSTSTRYHPYTKVQLPHLTPSSSLSSALSLSALTTHPLSVYYNPYSIYARASIGLHP